MSQEHESTPQEPMEKNQDLALLPLRNTVLFPQVVVPLAVGRPKSVRLIEDAVKHEKPIAVLTQRNAETDDPVAGDLYEIGTVARILKVVKIANDNYSVIIQGQKRIRLNEITQEEPYFIGNFDVLEPEAELSPEQQVEIEALFLNLKSTAKQVVKFIPEMPKEASQMVDGVNDPGQLCDFVVANMENTPEEKQAILETVDLKERLTKVVTLLARQLEVLRVSDKIQSQIKEEIDKNQREYYLRQQLKAIKEQLGELDGEGGDLEDIAQAIEEANLPKEVEEVCRKQMNRLRMMQPASSEYGVTRTYLETLLDIPWSKSTEDKLNIQEARTILDEDHYDLDKVKKRIIEYLAVRKLKNDMKGPILCLVGPPGVGKTSLGRSVARALGRKFVRISLGGVHDESEIRGHRRTYVGALPGRIVQALRKAGTNNPVFMLDEVDKIGRDFRGDPSAALLEVLDPAQNHNFSDHYMEVPVDLSNVLFVATANQLDTISAPLRDRMDVIEIPGYTAQDKHHISRQYLIPKALESHGITEENLRIDDEALDIIIRNYTREAGVRSLERRIADIARGVAVKVAENLGKSEEESQEISMTVAPDDIADYLGPERYQYEVAQRTSSPGVATGLAWTAAGGDILFIESTRMPGKGELVLTGQLGDVMKESVRAALSYIRSRAEDYELAPNFMRENDIHIHVPAGAIPKDGPSAGITMYISLLSLLTGVKVRSDVAMSGEITLRGNVLPVGGIKEKVLAAHRSGIKRIILPARNKKDLMDVSEDIQKELDFHFVEHVSVLPELVFEEGAWTIGGEKASDEASAE
ncbi:endopeptidase La [Bradymonadaceae bacterium TMQ3]|uniref:Lon protease n=1 Tax=Lujinxingia sediminis TaxID=2480984 RepID=A0ABY0CXR8_9DELT|nr:endopeptidase La [Lujinxingia sediminis]RDV39278.1 endopeptidase La [Bradymonadaceae bacterium TMQ3]RVU48683.1 endopeptidase La [Lujinxingia sediminis]TXC77976.1 endopeptidase La [Bradymonadales bacterium TMQ1]